MASAFRRPLPRPGPGEGDHRRTRHPAHRRASRTALRARRRVRRHSPQGLHRQAVGRNRRPGNGVRPPRRLPRRVAAVRTRHRRTGPLPAQGRQLPHHRRAGLAVCPRHQPQRPYEADPLPLPRQDVRLPRSGSSAHRRPPGRQTRGRRAEVSTGTVSNVLNHPDRVREDTRIRVELAIAELGFIRGRITSEHAAHWRRNGFATWLFTPAVSGWYPKKAPQEARPVPILGEPWPGIPARGREQPLGLTPAGPRLPRASHPTASATPTAR